MSVYTADFWGRLRTENKGGRHMRILELTSFMDTGGVETHLFCLARELVKMGDQVIVVSSGGRLAERLSREGVKHIRVDADARRPLAFWRVRARLRDIILSERVELIHAHSRIWAYLAYPVAREYGIPFVTTAHARFSVTPVYRRLSRWGDISIAVSDDLARYLCESYGVCAEKVRVVNNGIDTSAFYPNAGRRVPRRIVFISRLDRDCASAALMLCDVAQRLCERFEGLEIVIIGGGDAYESVRARSEQVCLRVGRQLIHLRGHIEDTASELQTAHLFVGVSRAALEALGCGALTILCGDEGALGLVDSEEKLLCAERTNFCCRGEKPFDADRLFREICKAFDLSCRKAEELSRLGATYVRDRHGSQRMATYTRLVYDEAKARARRRGRVLLCGYYGYGNMGDNALLRAAVSRAAVAFPYADITALTKKGRADSSVFDVRCVKRMCPLTLAREILGAEALIFGGGTLLQDRTSLRSLVYYAAVCRIARLRGVRVELWGNGLERARTAFATALVKSVLENASYIGLRDMRSVTEALRLVSPKACDRLYLEDDLARGQRAASAERVEYIQRDLGLFCEGRLVKYAVVAVKGSEGGGFLKILEGYLSELLSEGARLVFLPMFPREDRALCHKLSGQYDGVVAEGLSESYAVGLMRGAEIVCGMRLHALIFAAAADVPFVGVGSDPKIECFCRESGGLFFTDIM